MSILSPFFSFSDLLQSFVCRDVRKAWESASSDSRGDVRELIPEFFTCHEFLENLSGLELGTVAGGEKIGDVQLPPWAKADPLLFIQIHRKVSLLRYCYR